MNTEGTIRDGISGKLHIVEVLSAAYIRDVKDLLVQLDNVWDKECDRDAAQAEALYWKKMVARIIGCPCENPELTIGMKMGGNDQFVICHSCGKDHLIDAVQS